MKKFIFKILLIFGLPILIPILLFIIIDPFMLIGNNRGNILLKKNYNVTWNRDFQSTELFLKNNKEFQYNSFIMGNSRSFFYNIDNWNNYINGSCFHFNSSGESLFGVEKKIEFLSDNNVKIKNLLLILDYNTLQKTENSKGHLFIKHPQISGEPFLDFYVEMFNGFFPKSFKVYLDLYFTNEFKSYMNNYGITENILRHNKKNNQLYNFFYDSIINENPDNYYKYKKNIFYKRESIQLFYPIVIYEKQKKLLVEMKRVLVIQKTNYKIIINPLYDQKKISVKDLKYLKQLFGEENVFDFSGKNKFTEDYTNYYETSHYRPIVADEIMKIVYRSK